MALWKGLSSSLILVSNPIIQFVIYEQLKKTLSIDKSSGWYDLVIFLMGALSKMISTLCTYPITVVRTKQHISVGKDKWRKIVKNIVSQEGFKGLFKGIEPKLFQTVLNSALLLMLFERIKQILLNYFAKNA
jgi:adenine nucleotide transporter 17